MNIIEYRKEYYKQIINIIDNLKEWFDEKARKDFIPIDIKYQKVFIAEKDNKILGFITLFIYEGKLNIGWLGVKREFHNKGIGKKLLEKAENYAKEINIRKISTYTLGDSVEYEPYELTRKFYYNNGFRIYQRNKTDNPNCEEEIKLVKEI